MTNKHNDTHHCCDNYEDPCNCGCESEHEDGCNCDCDDDMDTMYITLEDGSEVECNVLGTFEIDDNEYIALLPLEDEEVLLYKFVGNEEGFQLAQIESEEEFDAVSEAFYELFVDDEEDEDEVYDDEEEYEEEEDEDEEEENDEE